MLLHDGHDHMATRLLKKVTPDVTAEFSAANLQSAVVQLAFDIGTDGTVTNIKVVRGFGMDLDEKAVEVIKQWKFKPAQGNGKPVPTPMTLDFVFRKGRS